MSKPLMNIIAGVIFLIMGLVFGIYRKQLADRTSDFWYRFLQIRYGQKGYELGFLIAGIISVAFGFLTLFQIIRFR